MKFRTGLAIGLGVGYVLGAKAGRERYEQIVSFLDSVGANPVVRTATSIADRTTRPIRRATGNGLVAASAKVREQAVAGNGGTTND